MENKMYELIIPAKVEKLPEVLAFIERHLEEADCPMKPQMQITIAAEEVFVNIAHYAYAPEAGDATVRLELTQDPPMAVLTFLDSGIPFDPLTKPDPDVTLGAEDREVGGLGIFMTKKAVDDVRYEYRDGQNILRLEKRL